MTIRFLLDENLSPVLKRALVRRFPDMDVMRVGEPGTPPLGTPDDEILQFAEQTRRLLVTDNRKSIPGHMIDHLASGRHHQGIVNISPNLSISQIVDELSIIWGASTAEEWIDRMDWIP